MCPSRRPACLSLLSRAGLGLCALTLPAAADVSQTAAFLSRKLSAQAPTNTSANTSVNASEIVGLYLGSGCFWHVQYELIQAEKTILGRQNSELTTVVGYAGGTGIGPDGRVCYDYSSDSNYAKLGHTEAVYLEIPRSSVRDFARVYWGLFVGIDRKDIVDVGPDYRAAIGIPGGMNSWMLAEFEAAQVGVTSQHMELRAGRGNDLDTLGFPLVYVYDLAEFPFYYGEVYHQFHDDFGGPYGSPPYPQSYNDLQQLKLSQGSISATGCPNDRGGQQRVITMVGGDPFFTGSAYKVPVASAVAAAILLGMARSM